MNLYWASVCTMPDRCCRTRWMLFGMSMSQSRPGHMNRHTHTDTHTGSISITVIGFQLPVNPLYLLSHMPSGDDIPSVYTVIETKE